MNVWRRLGPGILLAATSIGASHLVLSPQAGALFGFDLLWLVLLVHLLKYPAFEAGPRYAAATGSSLLAGYARMPGPRGWALWLFLVSTVLQGIGVLAGVVSVSGAVLYAWTGGFDPVGYSLIVIVLVVGLLFCGGFAWLDNLNKLMMAALALATLLAFVPVFPGPAAWKHLVWPSLPAGSLVLVAAVLGWMPTGIDVSIWHSFWTLKKLERLGLRAGCAGEAALEQRCTQLGLALGDMRTGYGLSLATGVMFVIMGAVHLAGRGAELEGVGFVEALSSAYTNVLGRWMFHVFMVTAFCAMFSTSYTVIDGFSRSFAEVLAALFPARAGGRRRRQTYRGFVLVSSALAAVTLAWIGNPVTVVTAVALLSLAVAPVLYALNLICIQRHIEEPRLQPARTTTLLGWLGVATMVLAVAATVYVKLLR